MLTIKLPSLQRLAALKNPGNLTLAMKASTIIVAVSARARRKTCCRSFQRQKKQA